ncbi:hypothetical protein [Flavobacterium difficile]|uniref:Lipoprotein n=1 Tax=Flavobacterium difficile TaxID=2709659 RepID=A0ABX0I6P9_9FLAO|nr:hypothetical protein [Flavobacterium difficile]NHM02599.1 hypothetical protein [Flavobacterium difficile]
MKKLFIITLVILSYSCSEKEKKCFENFTYMQSNLKSSYLLKINSSDTVYYLNRYSYELNDLYYFLLIKSEKEKLNNLICKLKFPINDSLFLNDNITDGTTLNFSMDNKRLSLHGGEGPKEFWKFAKWMDNLMTSKQLKAIKNRAIKFDKILEIPIRKVPPIIKKL